jgi:hypothetical protein
LKYAPATAREDAASGQLADFRMADDTTSIENYYVLANTDFSGFRHLFFRHFLCQLRRDAVFSSPR